jgi:hypothetical protein
VARFGDARNSFWILVWRRLWKLQVG